MSEPQSVFARIASLRRRLQQTPPLALNMDHAEGDLLVEDASRGSVQGDQARPATLGALLDQVSGGAEFDTQLQQLAQFATHQVGAPSPTARHSPTGPRLLTTRARRLLEQGRELIAQLRSLADVVEDDSEAEENTQPTITPGQASLSALYRQANTLVQMTLRTITLLPDSATIQLQICAGLEGTLDHARKTLDKLHAKLQQRNHEQQRVARLARLLRELVSCLLPRMAGVGEDSADCTSAEQREVPSIHPQAFFSLADELLEEAHRGTPIRFIEDVPDDADTLIAAHSLAVARVLARVAPYSPDLKTQTPQAIQLAVIAALVHDVGMLLVPDEILFSPDSLDDDQRRQVEAHCREGRERVRQLFPEFPVLTEAVAWHHERPGGRGYPEGLGTAQLQPMTNLLMVCDIYAALCQPRPHRPARTPRTALADTLLLADQDQLDRQACQALLHLSFYPIGSVVELTSGAMGVVVATHPTGNALAPDFQALTRPVVEVLTDPQGRPLPLPHHEDLARSDQVRIVRGLTAEERQRLLSKHFPEWI